MAEARIFVACLLGLFAGSAVAQSFPSGPLKLICPCFPASGFDQYLREFARIASRYVGQPIVVQNMGG
jgi:tripartite-type tricarboxylate transporter receptor subunit TctC